MSRVSRDIAPRKDIKKWMLAPMLLALIFLGAACTKGIPANVSARLKPVTLEWWGVNETEEEVGPIIAAYQKEHSNVSIAYRRFRYTEYEQQILDALSEREFRGPDILTVPSTWTRKYQSRIQPAPRSVTMPFKEMRGTVKKELYAELRTVQLPAPQEIRNIFLDAIAGDAVVNTIPTDGKPSTPAVYGLPLSMDTLVLYANRDLLNAAGIPEPAKTWTELQTHIPRLTRLDAKGAIVQSGAAIGTAKNVQRYADILSLLMMQSGAVMAGPNGEPTFHLTPQSLAGQRETSPGVGALLYYTDFANPQRVTYTWNDDQPDSLETFVQGRVAYFFGYSYHLPIIKARAPRINLSVTGIPHTNAAVDPTTGTIVGADVIEGTQSVAINYANFWLTSVTARTKYVNEAWDFVRYATMGTHIVERTPGKPASEPIAQMFLSASGRPTALRSLVAQQLQNPDLKIFAAQLLTARTWYHGRKPEAAEQALRELIEDIVGGRLEPQRAIQIAAEKVGQTL